MRGMDPQIHGRRKSPRIPLETKLIACTGHGNAGEGRPLGPHPALFRRLRLLDLSAAGGLLSTNLPPVTGRFFVRALALAPVAAHTLPAGPIEGQLSLTYVVPRHL